MMQLDSAEIAIKTSDTISLVRINVWITNVEWHTL